MNLEKARIESIGNITRNGAKDPRQLTLDITFYQRPYRWKNDRIEALFGDYIENRKMAEKDKNDKEKAKEYFLGAVVLVEKKDDQNSAEYEVVDGQQRLTTIFLMNYLKFSLLRARIEELIEFNPSNIKQEMEMMISCYSSFVGKKNVAKMEKMKTKIYTEIDKHGAAAWGKKDINSILKTYRKVVGLPDKKDLSDQEVYYNLCVQANTQFYKNEQFCLRYSYDAYTESLREALADIVIIFSNSIAPDWDRIPTDTEEEWPFVNRAKDILNQLYDYQDKFVKKTAPEDIIQEYINFLDEMINKLNLCEIITTKADDAYKLFETLNDRSERVSDLELMKDYFYKYYVKTSGDGKKTVNTNLTKLDEIWVSNLNSFEKEIRFWVAYCSTVFITGNKDLKQNDSLTKEIDKYLADKTQRSKYSYTDIDQDFNVFNLVSDVFKNISNGGFRNIAYTVENDKDASIVKATLALLLQIDYKAIGACVICDILYNYLSLRTTISFSDYLGEIFDEKICISKYNTLWEEICVIWKTTILSENFELPKKYSDQIIQNRKKDNLSIGAATAACVAITPAEAIDIQTKFEAWASTWTYRKGVHEKQKIKLLFFHLMLKYDYSSLPSSGTDDVLRYLSTAPRAFKKDVVNQDLDHVEGETINTGRRQDFYKCDDRTRLNEINSIANMMILSRRSNAKKQNVPMGEGIAFYKKECDPHWLIDEMETIYNSNKCANSYGRTVPAISFFEKRTARLLEYFHKIVLGTDSKHSDVIVSKP